LLNGVVTQQPPRRRLEQASPEKERRTGCLVTGAVLGVLVGIMVGIYALPPILRNIYGETKVAADEFYRGDARIIRVTSAGRASEPLGDPSPGTRREDFFVELTVRSNKTWAIVVTDFTLELEGVKDWIKAAEATTNGEPGLNIPLGEEVTVQLHFIVEVPTASSVSLAAEALHLANPRVRFALQ
jgi:hypothetical protein